MLLAADTAPQSAHVVLTGWAASRNAWLSAHAPRHHPAKKAVLHKERRTISAPVRPASLPTAWTEAWAGHAAPVFRFATCVAHHESWSAGLWTARNSHSTASGFAQWLDGTWRVNAARAGVPGAPRAFLASPADQVSVFAWMFAHGGQRAWAGSHCGYGT